MAGCATFSLNCPGTWQQPTAGASPGKCSQRNRCCGCAAYATGYATRPGCAWAGVAAARLQPQMQMVQPVQAQQQQVGAPGAGFALAGCTTATAATASASRVWYTCDSTSPGAAGATAAAWHVARSERATACAAHATQQVGATHCWIVCCTVVATDASEVMCHEHRGCVPVV